MFDTLVRIVFMITGALGVSSFFGTALNSESIAIISGLISVLVMFAIAFFYKKKTGKTIIK